MTDLRGEEGRHDVPDAPRGLAPALLEGRTVFRPLLFGSIEFDGDFWVIPAAVVVLAVPLFLVGFRLLSASQPPAGTPAEGSAPSPFGSARHSISRRRSQTSLVVFVPGATPAASRLVPGWVLRRSPGGLCLTIGSAVMPAVVLRLRHPNASKSTAWTLIEVQRCELAGGCWELDCRFVEPEKQPDEAIHDEPATPVIQ